LLFETTNSPKSKISWLGGRYGVLFFTFVVTAAFVSVWTHQLWLGKERALLVAEVTTANLARAIEVSNSRTIQAVDLILSNVATSAKPGHWTENSDVKKFFQALLDEAPQVREVAFVNATGLVTDISRRGPLPILSIAGEAYFKKAQDGLLQGLYMSTPYGGRLLGESPSQQWHLIAARAVYDDEENFLGVALAVLNPGFFQEQFSALDIGRKGMVTLYRYDGEVLVQSGMDGLNTGDTNHADTELFKTHLVKQEWGTYRQFAPDLHDHRENQIISYRATTRWPLLVVVSLHQDEALMSWYLDTRDFSTTMGVGLTVLFILAFIVFRQRTYAETTEQKLRLLSTALKTSANMVLITDINAKIVWVNDAFCTQFGYDFSEVAGQNPRILNSGMMTPAVYEELWSTILNGKMWNGEFINRRKDGTLVIVNQTISPITDADGQVTHFIGIHDDITENKEKEIELREAKISAEASNKVKTQFLANMSHELRTPLNAVLGFTDMMRMETFGPLGHKKYDEYANDIHSSASHLLTLISDILDVSKIEAGKMNLTDDHIQLDELAESCRILLSLRSLEKKISLVVSIPENMPILIADEVRIKQIVLNLLTNSIKFTPPEGHVTLTLNLTNQGGIKISVKDDGVGIAPGDLAKILEPFGQANDTSSLSCEGVGLGLYLVKIFAEMHGGHIDVVSDLGIGTLVSVTFPPERCHRADI